MYYVCMYVMYVYMHVYMYYVYMYVRVYVCMYVFLLTYSMLHYKVTLHAFILNFHNTVTYIYTYVQFLPFSTMHVCTYECACMYVSITYVCMYVSKFVFMYV